MLYLLIPFFSSHNYDLVRIKDERGSFVFVEGFKTLTWALPSTTYYSILGSAILKASDYPAALRSGRLSST